MALAETLVAPAPERGQLVVVRDRHWIVTGVTASSLPRDELSTTDPGAQHLVELASVEEDGLGEDIAVIWEVEPAAQVLETATLPTPRLGHFDEPDRLDAFLDAVRWGAVTSADSKALQSPFRSGIQIEDYQLDPVVRALRMPRVNLLVADDVGLGKTIEAGLVIQELLLRHRARTVLIVCPASLCLKWQAEMVEKFGLDFRIVDTAMLRELRRSRGLGANPFRVYPRLIVSIDWLKRPRAMSLLADVLPPDPNVYPRRFDLLVVDEVHQCAPAGRGNYAIDSQRTKAIRALSPHFEHRLFLSATPHNGYTESFTALLELLDPQRFARGVQPNPDTLASAVVRRLKSDITKPDGSRRFAERVIVPLEVEYPGSERKVHDDLARYAELRRTRAKNGSARVASEFVTLLLKKRLFSSPAAFANTLDVHKHTLAAAAAKGSSEDDVVNAFGRLDEDVEDDQLLTDVTGEALTVAARATEELTAEESELLDRMTAWGETNRHRPDAKTERLLEWLSETCTEVDDTGQRWWNNERVIVFTEYRDTQLYLLDLLESRGLGGEHVELLYGGMDKDTRERIKAEFQHHPDVCPVRILLATDAASEGIDLQRYCHRIVHVEIPFSPTRLEQRNGRVDRHGQPAPEVLIHHFVGAGWKDASATTWLAERGGLEADLGFLSLIARKVDTIRDDLGAAGPVLAAQVEAAMLGRKANPDAAPTSEHGKTARALNRLERNLRERIAELRAQLDESIEELHLTPESVERVVRIGLELGRQAPLQRATLVRPETDPDFAATVFEVPALTRSWATATLDLYDDITGVQRPVTFDHEVARDADDVVLAHLNHRLVAQAMRTLRAEIWSSGAETRLGRVTARIVDEATAPDIGDLGVVAYARLVVVGGDGRRLHEEVISAGGRVRKGRFARWNVGETKNAMQAATSDAAGEREDARVVALWPDIEGAVYASLDARGKERTEALQRKLAEREEADVEAITGVLTDLQRSITAELDELEGNNERSEQLQLFDPTEREQWRRDVDALRRRLAEIPEEIEREVAAVKVRYMDPTPRLFPAAVEFLVAPRSGKGGR